MLFWQTCARSRQKYAIQLEIKNLNWRNKQKRAIILERKFVVRAFSRESKMSTDCLTAPEQPPTDCSVVWAIDSSKRWGLKKSSGLSLTESKLPTIQNLKQKSTVKELLLWHIPFCELVKTDSVQKQKGHRDRWKTWNSSCLFTETDSYINTHSFISPGRLSLLPLTSAPVSMYISHALVIHLVIPHKRTFCVQRECLHKHHCQSFLAGRKFPVSGLTLCCGFQGRTTVSVTTFTIQSVEQLLIVDQSRTCSRDGWLQQGTLL